MKCASLVRRQIMTRMAVNGGELVEELVFFEEGGSSVLWSQEMEDQGRVGIGSGLSSPWGGR